MIDIIKDHYNQLRQQIIFRDKRFSVQNGKLYFSGCDVTDLARKYGTPIYVFSESEIVSNIREIEHAFIRHSQTKVFYASKACSVMSVLKSILNADIGAVASSQHEIRKCLEIGFHGNQIVFNGAIKQPADLEYAINNNLYLIKIDSLYELDLIDTISRKLKKTANVCVQIDPNVLSTTYAELTPPFHTKSGINLEQAEEACQRILAMPYVHLRGLQMHVGNQFSEYESIANLTRVLVDESRRLEQLFGIKFELINVGGGVPVSYKYNSPDDDPLTDNMYVGMTAQDFAHAILHEIHKWRTDIEICIEPGRKVISSAAVLLSKFASEKRKANYDINGNVGDHIEWKFIDAGYSVLPGKHHVDGFFYVFNASQITEPHDNYIKLAGPLCDSGDYFHIGIRDEEYLVPIATQIGDIAVLLDAGAYTIESQTVCNNCPRTAVVMIDINGKDRLIRRKDTYADLVSYDIY